MPTLLIFLVFLIFMACLIAGYFYLYWAKSRDASKHTDAHSPNTQEGR